jgi:hypothetical protein
VSEGVLGKILKLKDIVPWGHYGALRKLQLRDTGSTTKKTEHEHATK